MDRLDWEVSYDPEIKRDVIIIDMGDDIIRLTVQDLKTMLEELLSHE